MPTDWIGFYQAGTYNVLIPTSRAVLNQDRACVDAIQSNCEEKGLGES